MQGRVSLGLRCFLDGSSSDPYFEPLTKLIISSSEDDSLELEGGFIVVRYKRERNAVWAYDLDQKYTGQGGESDSPDPKGGNQKIQGGGADYDTSCQL